MPWTSSANTDGRRCSRSETKGTRNKSCHFKHSGEAHGEGVGAWVAGVAPSGLSRLQGVGGEHRRTRRGGVRGACSRKHVLFKGLWGLPAWGYCDRGRRAPPQPAPTGRSSLTKLGSRPKAGAARRMRRVARAASSLGLGLASQALRRQAGRGDSGTTGERRGRATRGSARRLHHRRAKRWRTVSQGTSAATDARGADGRCDAVDRHARHRLNIGTAMAGGQDAVAHARAHPKLDRAQLHRHTQAYKHARRPGEKWAGLDWKRHKLHELGRQRRG